MPLRRTKPTRPRAPPTASTVATCGAFAVALALVLGVGSGNMAVVSVSLSIGVGAFIGWFLAGVDQPDNVQNNP